MSAHATLVAVTQPDVAVVDIHMPSDGDSGRRAAREIRVRIGTSASSRSPIRASYALGLLGDSTERVGYLHQRPPRQPGRAADAVRRVGRGGSVLDPVVLPQLVGRPAPAPRGPRRASRPQRA
jgi:DNA-binding NarL/FixJ family response regulator